MSRNLLILGGIAAALYVFRDQITQMVNAILPSASPEGARIDSSQPSTYRETYQSPGGPITDYKGTGQPGVGTLSFSEPMGTNPYPAGPRTQIFPGSTGTNQSPAGAGDPALTMQQVPTGGSSWDNALNALMIGAIVAPPAYSAIKAVAPKVLQKGGAVATRAAETLKSAGSRIGATLEEGGAYAAEAIPTAARAVIASPIKAGAAAVVITGAAYAVTHPTETKAAVQTIAQKSAAVVDVAKQRLTTPPTKPVLIPAIIKAVKGK